MNLALALLLCMFSETHGFNNQHSVEPQPNFDLEKVSMIFYLFFYFEGGFSIECMLINFN